MQIADLSSAKIESVVHRSRTLLREPPMDIQSAPLDIEAVPGLQGADARWTR